jgi:lipopolysaccharide/colanic/teichoic acid biosynthesis glycosyltransferase
VNTSLPISEAGIVLPIYRRGEGGTFKSKEQVIRMAVVKSQLSARSTLSRKTRVAAHSVNRDRDVMPEDTFLQFLQWEVRRTERSGRPFMLALIRSDAFGGESGRRIVNKLVAAIEASTRETDRLGWYEHNETLGIVLTEIGETNEAKVKLLGQKIKLAMQQAVSAREFERLSLIIRLFPQHSIWSETDGWDDDIFRDLQRKRGPGSGAIIYKRAIDIAGSLFTMLLFLPIFVTLAILVKLTSRGPVFYCQKRVGQNGKLFDFYKFRSMYVDNDPEVHREYVTQLIKGAKHVQQSNGMYKLANDSRVTRLGRFLRKSSLDELPQFFNVLRGDMSMVGPRPPLPYEFAHYRTWHRRRVLEVKPGLTGLWQVKGRSRTTFEEMVRMDLHYARTWSPWMDIKIILQTPAAMFTATGAS